MQNHNCDDIRGTMHKALAGLRKQAGLSGYRLAQRAGLTPHGYYQIEAGRSKPTYDSLMKLARALADALGRKPSDVLAELTEINDEDAVLT